MEREILFRGKRVDNGEWVEGYLTPFSGIDYKDKNRFVIHSGIIECHEVIPETVGQFTGMLDKNGQKIFEGDKFECDDVFDDSYYLVEWNEELCKFQLNVYSHSMYFNEGNGEEFSKDLELCDEDYFEIGCLKEMKIIGNIHDSPELL